VPGFQRAARDVANAGHMVAAIGTALSPMRSSVLTDQVRFSRTGRSGQPMRSGAAAS